MGNLGKLLLGVLLIAVAVGTTYAVLQETGPQSTDKAMVGFIFDDGNSDVYAHRDLFASQGVKVSVAIIGEQVDHSCCMSWEQIKKLQDQYGWTFLNHTKSHRRFSDANVAEVRNQVRSLHKEAAQHSVTLKGLVYPYDDEGSPEDWAVVAELYHYAFRRTDRLITEESEPYILDRYSMDKNTIAEIKEMVDKAVNQGADLIMHGHHIVEKSPQQEGPFSVSTKKLNDLIDYIQTHPGNVEIALPSEVVKHYSVTVGEAAI